MIRPLWNFVVVRELEKELTAAGGKIILQQDKRAVETIDAEIVALGDTVERKIKVGETAIVDKTLTKPVCFDGVEYLIVPEDCVIAVIEGGKKRGK